uniref:MLO-like protein n=1 Tax=Quercus lobata TaxID=97700 RepID=A0A7N2QYI8_QUELO
MGSHMKQAIFEEQTAKALKKWHKAVKDKKKLRKGGVDSSSGFMSGENTPSRGTSPIHLLHKHQSNKSDFEADLYSPKSYQSDTDLPEIEGSTTNRHASRTEGQPTRTEESHNIDFTFVKA